jgi:hypothetical protein
MWPAELVDPHMQGPHLKAFMNTMASRKGVAAYLSGDRCLPLLYPSMLPEDYVTDKAKEAAEAK